MINRQREGYGELIHSKTGTSYSGEFQRGEYSGTGMLTKSDGRKFVGDFKDG